MSGVGFVAGTVVFTVASQLLLKWRVGLAGRLPQALGGKVLFVFHQLCDPWVLLGLLSAFAAALCWIAALTRFELSRAYPLTSASFVLVMILSAVLLGESVTVSKVIGIVLIVAGIAVIGLRP